MYDEIETDWSFRERYMQTRHGVSPTEANEALRDPFRVVLEPDPSSKSGAGIRVIGMTAARRLLTVIVMNLNGLFFGVNRWMANTTDFRRYFDLTRGDRP